MILDGNSRTRKVANLVGVGFTSIMLAATTGFMFSVPASANQTVDGNPADVAVVTDGQDVDSNGNVTETLVVDEKPRAGKVQGTPPESDCPSGDCDVSEGQSSERIENINTVDETLWFYDERVVNFSTPVGSASETYDSMLRYCPNPTALKNYPYNGNAIPLPAGPDSPRETRNVKVRIKVATYDIVTDVPYLLTVRETDPVTGEVTTTTRDLGVRQDRQAVWEFQFTCGSQTAPSWGTKSCTTSIRYQVNGPYDQRKERIPSIEAGGTNVRVPLGDGRIGWEGEERNYNSRYGEALAGNNTSDAGPARSGTPSIAQASANCLPGRNDSFEETVSDNIKSLGRYEAPTRTWKSSVNYFKFTTENWQNIYMGIARQQAPRPARMVVENGVGWYIIRVNPITPSDTFSYYKAVCLDGTVANKKAYFSTVARSVKETWDQVNWDDAGENYYSWDCGPAPGDPNQVRANDLLVCDSYGQRATAPYQYDRLDYTYSTGTRPTYGYVTVNQFMDRGADYINGQWIGRPCPAGWGDAGHNCVQSRQVWGQTGTESYRIKNPTPAGYTDNGSYWVKKAAPPAGWTDNGTEYETTTYSNIVVDNKNAAPIMGTSQVVNGEVQSVEFANGVYYISSAADPVHVEWARPRINLRDGRNINEGGKNVVWEYNYKLAPWSSPKLKNTPVNAPDQPYHGWLDSTASNVDPAEVPPDQKWEPDKFYEFVTIPYSFTYAPYTYTKNFEYRNYTYRNVWVKTGSYCTCCAGLWWGGCTCGTKHDCCLMCPDTGYWTTAKNPPPSGFYDDGTRYVREYDVRNPAPAGWEDIGTGYRRKNAPPYGFVDTGTQYVSADKLNISGKTGGIAFDEWREWPSTEGLSDCTINTADYNSGSKTYSLKCGDNVTDNTRGAYFRFFQSTTANQLGWQVTPWWKVTADVQTDFTEVVGFQPTQTGALIPIYKEVTGKWVRESYECPGQPFLINIERIATN